MASFLNQIYPTRLTAIIIGIVSTERSEQNATTVDATPVSFPYFAENITVFVALGTDAEIIHAVIMVPERPINLKITNIIDGNTRSFKIATR